MRGWLLTLITAVGLLGMGDEGRGQSCVDCDCDRTKEYCDSTTFREDRPLRPSPHPDIVRYRYGTDPQTGRTMHYWRGWNEDEQRAVSPGNGSKNTAPDLEISRAFAYCADSERPFRLWHVETGSARATCEDTGVIRQGALVFADDVRTCVQLQDIPRMPGSWDSSRSLRMSLDFETAAVEGTTTWSVAVGCSQRSVARAAQTFNAPSRSVPIAVPEVATAPTVVTFNTIDSRNCKKWRPLHIRVCLEAQDLPEGRTVKGLMATIFIPQLP